MYQVFRDQSGSRWKQISFFGKIILFISICTTVIFFTDLSNTPEIGSVKLGHAEERMLTALPSEDVAVPSLLLPAANLAAQLRSLERNIWWAAHTGAARIAQLNQRAKPANGAHAKPLSIGFYVNWDDRSFTSLKAHIADLDWVIPSWLTMTGADMTLSADVDAKGLALMRGARPTMPILPMLQNSIDGKWEGDNLARFLANPEQRKARLAEIVAFLSANQLQGLTVDFESVPREAHADLQKFLSEMADAFRPNGWRIVLCIPFDDEEWNYGVYAKLVDFELLMGTTSIGRRAGRAASPASPGSRRSSTNG